MTRRGRTATVWSCCSGHCHCATAMRGQSVSGSAITTCRRFDCVFEKEYASRHIFLGVAGKKARQGARLWVRLRTLGVLRNAAYPASVRDMLSRINRPDIKMCKFRTRSVRPVLRNIWGMTPATRAAGRCGPAARRGAVMVDWTIATDVFTERPHALSPWAPAGDRGGCAARPTWPWRMSVSGLSGAWGRARGGAPVDGALCETPGGTHE